MTTLDQTSAPTLTIFEQAPSAVTSPPNSKQTKKQKLQILLEQEAGASSQAIETTFGWQPHTVRAAISGLRKAGSTVVCTSSPSGPISRIALAASAQ